MAAGATSRTSIEYFVMYAIVRTREKLMPTIGSAKYATFGIAMGARAGTEPETSVAVAGIGAFYTWGHPRGECAK